MTKFTAEFPVAGGRLIPFVTGGGGVGRLSERIDYRCDRVCPLLGQPGANIDIFTIFPLPNVELGATGLALTVGGGLDVRLWQGLAVGADVRWVRLLVDQRDFDFAHVATRVSYRF